MQVIARKGVEMRLALIVMYIFFISATGLTAHSSIPDDTLYDGISIRHGWAPSDLFNNNWPNKQLTAIDSQLFIANDYLFDDCLSSAHQKPTLSTNDDGGTNRIDNLDDKFSKFAGRDYLAMHAGTKLSNANRNGDHELEERPRPSNKSFDKMVSWLKNAYHVLTAKDRYGSTRLLLLSFGLVGIIGIRRKFTKH